MITGSGLIGTYYANETSFKEGVPVTAVIDEQISFSIRRLNDKNLFSYVVWTGYLSFPHTSDFEFEVTGVEGSLKLWIGDRIVLDTDNGLIRGSFRAFVNIIYEIKIEYSLVRAFLSCFHSSGFWHIHNSTLFPIGNRKSIVFCSNCFGLPGK
jgi:hypothetical protein